MLPQDLLADRQTLRIANEFVQELLASPEICNSAAVLVMRVLQMDGTMAVTQDFATQVNYDTLSSFHFRWLPERILFCSCWLYDLELI